MASSTGDNSTSLIKVTPTYDDPIVGYVLSKGVSRMVDGFHTTDLILKDHLASVYVQLRAYSDQSLLELTNLFEVDAWYQLIAYDNLPAMSHAHASRCSSTIIVTTPSQVYKLFLPKWPSLSIAGLRHLPMFHTLDTVVRDHYFFIAAFVGDQILYEGCEDDTCDGEARQILDGVWECSKCFFRTPQFMNRYRMMITLTNETGVLTAAVSNESVGSSIIGMSAEDFAELEGQNPQAAAATKQAIIGRFCLMKIQVRGIFDVQGNQVPGANEFTILSTETIPH